MRKILPLLSLVACLATAPALAGETKTINGDAVCAKCAMKETKTCQNAVMVEADGKKTTYYLDGDKSKDAHKKLGICSATKAEPIKVKVTGDVSEKDGKMVMMVDKIEKVD